MAARLARTLLTLALVGAGGVAAAQMSAFPYPAQSQPTTPAPGVPAVTTVTPSGSYSAGDAQAALQALASAKRGDAAGVRAAMYQTVDPTARKIALWALVDAAPAQVSFAEADLARRELALWPRPGRRQEAAETLLGGSGLAPAAVIAWFNGAAPRTGGGALALATALRATGQAEAAAAAVKRAWRELPFDQITQENMLAAFYTVISVDDDIAREDMLLYGGHDAAALDLLRLLPPEQQALAQARMALRRGDTAAESMVAALPAALQNAPGVAYERALAFRERNDPGTARRFVAALPMVLPDQAAAVKLWKHGAMVSDALKSGDWSGAYLAATHSGLTTGPEAAEARFYAGWIALTRLHDPRRAEDDFAAVAEAGTSPLTQARSFYWRGRAAEAAGDPVAAQLFYGQGARFPTAFYGQLAAEKAGVTTLTLGHDPAVTTADRARFESLDVVRAMRYLAGIGAKDEFRVFAADLADALPNGPDEAMLVDLAGAYGDPQVAMRVVRNAARRGVILPERGYPIRTPPLVADAPEPAFVLAIVRQESSFDPHAHSGAGARGMMQLMPATAQILARRVGVSYSAYELEDADYNMRLGSAYLGQLVGQFSGSYIMAAAAYNAGPGRPVQWTIGCGDPRGGSTDPLDWIECIPFSETRDYVMRVLEATEIYRARLHGGSTPLTLANDLKRGAYGYH